MTPVQSILGSPGLLGSESETIAVDVETQAALSTALVSVFRGKFCDLILTSVSRRRLPRTKLFTRSATSSAQYSFCKEALSKSGPLPPLAAN